MEYRDFMSLTDEEIIFIVTDIFKPVKIENIVRNKEWNEINCDITTTWGLGTKEDPYEDIVDELTLKENGMEINFSMNSNDRLKWKQYLLARGCNKLLKDNPYLNENQ